MSEGDSGSELGATGDEDGNRQSSDYDSPFAGMKGGGVSVADDAFLLEDSKQPYEVVPSELPSQPDVAPFDEEEDEAAREHVSFHSQDTACNAQHRVSPAVELLHREQEAYWLGKEHRSDKANRSQDDQAEDHQEFRVYPHYIPIPACAEASLPFLSGQPLSALGNDKDDEIGVENDEGVEQKLQFQLAIHDISVCWRLFKGNDWHYRANEECQFEHVEGGGSSDDLKSTRSSQASPLEISDVKARSWEQRGEYTDAPSTLMGHSKPKRSEILDSLLENYQDTALGQGDTQRRCPASRRPKVRLLNQRRESKSDSSTRHAGRDTSYMLEIVLEHTSIRLDSFHPGPAPSLLSNLLLTIKNVQALDTLTSSRPRKTLQHWRDDVHHPREYQQKMVSVRMTTRSPSDHFCPGDTPLGDEIMLKVRILPVRLSFGQHTVDFLRSFAHQPPLVHGRGTGLKDGEDNQDHDGGERSVSPFFVSCCDIGACKVCLRCTERGIEIQLVFRN